MVLIAFILLWKNPFVIFWFSGIADSTLINNTNETLIEPVRKCSLLLEIEAAFMKEKLLEEQKRKCKSLKWFLAFS